jgi:3-hydroxyisobutyrate dehydrogenase-like beta-hydroxyacid dehydrogenase
MVDAPVSAVRRRQKATLTIFVGVTPTRRTRPARPGGDGKTITHVGLIGAGQAVKAVNQVILAGTTWPRIVLAIKAGLDVEQVVEASVAAQPRLGARQPQQPDARQRLPAQVRVALHRKDLRIALDLATQLGAVLPVTALAAQLETDSSPAATPRTTCPPAGPSALCRRSTTEARFRFAVSRVRPGTWISELAVVARPGWATL